MSANTAIVPILVIIFIATISLAANGQSQRHEPISFFASNNNNTFDNSALLSAQQQQQPSTLVNNPDTITLTCDYNNDENCRSLLRQAVPPCPGLYCGRPQLQAGSTSAVLKQTCGVCYMR